MRFAASGDPSPRRARRQRQLDPQRIGGRLAACDRVGVGERPRRQPGDMREAIVSTGSTSNAAQTSRPCAQVSINRAVMNDGGAHPDAPRNTHVGIERRRTSSCSAAARVSHHESTRGPGPAPAAQHARGTSRLRSTRAGGAIVDGAGPPRRGRDRHLVGVGQMGDRVADVPARAGVGASHASVIDRAQSS